jgi:hypothetical protein
VLVGDEVLLGSTVRFDASRAKVVKIGPDPADPLNLARCETTYHSVFDIRVGTPFQWQVVERPPASAASLQGANGLTPTLVVDRPGEYHVRFTGCPTQPCKLAEPDVGIPRIEHTLMVTAVTEVAIPPDTEPPTLPGEPSPFATISDQEAARFCYGPPLPFPSPNTPPGPSNTWQSPQLVTVMRWAGPQHYELLEGRVRAAHVSRSDNDMNHDDNDFGFNVVLDPPYRRLERPGQDHPDFPEVHVEWEWSRIPDRYRPTRGDRTSVWGFWVLDCHHDDPIRTEIHPPVMVVSHRPRAVLLPEKFGSNVYVPGIVSDLWVNRDGRTNDRRLPRFRAAPADRRGMSATDPGLLRREPIAGRTYEFKIHLPRNPRRLYADAGVAVPSAPIGLYINVLDPLNGQPVVDDRLQIEPSQDGSHLRARLNLAGFTSARYARRTVAAWEFPSPTNWGLRRWRLRVDSLRIHNDGDPAKGDGEWRLFFSTNSVDKEWTQHRFGASEGTYDFDGSPYETGNPDPDRSLGSDLLLFPEQRIWLHAGGYETDATTFEDATGDVNDLLSQAEAQSALGGAADYCEAHNRTSFCTLSSCLSQSTLAAAGPEYLDMLRDAVPGELWSQYFADIQWPPGRQEAEKWRRVAAWLAVVALAAIGTLVFLSRWWAPSGP